MTVELDLTSGSDAKKWDEIAKQENLKPLEVELRRLEDIVSSIQSEFEYISQREQLARDVNGLVNRVDLVLVSEWICV